MKRYILIITSLLSFASAKAQYTATGKIEYERRTNVIRALDDLDEDSKRWAEKFKSQLPNFTTAYFDLYFTTAKTLYKPGRESDNTTRMWFAQSPAAENIVLTDFGTSSVKATKQIFEKKFLVQDTMRQMQWTIKDEIRTIANFKCRKAVGKICDSVYVVAFYTEDILASGGPEMFCGLPGMILEVAIPRLYTTWIATKVELTAPKETDLTVPDKGKKVTQKELYESLKDSFKDWDELANKNIWWTML